MDRREKDDLFRIPNEEPIPEDAMGEEEVQLRKLLADFSRNPDDTDTLIQITELLMKLQLFQEAWPYLERYLAKITDDPQALNWAGYIHFVQDDFAKAQLFLEEAIHLDPDLRDALYNSAMVYSGRGEFEKARSRFERLAELEDQNPEVLNNLGTLLFQSNDLEAAETRFRQALDLDREHGPSIQNLVEVLLEQGRNEEAQGWFETFERTDPPEKELETLRARITGDPAPTFREETGEMETITDPFRDEGVGLRIGIFSDWAPSDRGDLAWWIRQSLVQNGHDPHVFARTGRVPHCKDQDRNVYPRCMGRWVVPNLTLTMEHPVPEALFDRWLDQVQPQVVIFIDSSEPRLVQRARETGVMAVACPAFIGAGRTTAANLSIFDAVFAVSPWIQTALEDGLPAERVVYTDLGIDLERFRPRKTPREETVFLYDAGHGSVEDLENLLTMLTAFGMMEREAAGRARLLVRTGVDWNLLPDEIRNRGEGNPRVEVVSGHVEDPWFLNMGHILVHLKLTPGLHLMVPEAAACGVPSLVLDRSPAVGWILDEQMILKVPRAPSTEGEGPGRSADVKTLSDTMSSLAQDIPMVDYMGDVCREKAEQLLDGRERGQAFSDKLAASLAAWRGIRAEDNIYRESVPEQGEGEEGAQPERILEAIEEAIASGRTDEAKELMTIYRHGLD